MVQPLERSTELAGAFLQWWRNELLSLVPLRVRRAWNQRWPLAYINLYSDRTVVDLVDQEQQRRLLCDTPLEELDAEEWAQLDEIIRSRKAIMVLHSPQCHVVHTLLPKGALSHAQRVLELRLGRLSPVLPDTLVWNWIVDAGAVEPQAAIAMVKRDDVSRLDRLLADNGLPMPSLAAANGDTLIHLTPGHDGAQTPARKRDRILIAASVCLLLSVPVTSLLALSMTKSAVSSRIDDLQYQAGPNIALRARAQRNAAIARQVKPLAETPSVSLALEKLSQALPAGARLQSFMLGSDQTAEVTIEGASSDALIEDLRAVFPAVEARSETTQDPSMPGTQGPTLMSLEIRL